MEQSPPRSTWSPGEGMEILSQFSANGIRVFYLLDPGKKSVGLSLVPEASLEELVGHRASYWGTPAWTVDSLVHLKCVGDSYPSLFCQGKTMRNSASTSGIVLCFPAGGCPKNGNLCHHGFGKWPGLPLRAFSKMAGGRKAF